MIKINITIVIKQNRTKYSNIVQTHALLTNDQRK